MPYQVNPQHAAALRDYAFQHPELQDVLVFADHDVVQKYIAVIGSDEVVNEMFPESLGENDIFIDPSYNNIYTDFLTHSMVSEESRNYIKYYVDKQNTAEIIDIINNAIINPLLSMKNIDAENVYIRIHDGTNAYLFNEVLRLD